MKDIKGLGNFPGVSGNSVNGVDMLIGDCFFTMLAMKKLLIAKGLFTEQELATTIETLTIELFDKIAKEYPAIVDIIKPYLMKGDPSKN